MNSDTINLQTLVKILCPKGRDHFDVFYRALVVVFKPNKARRYLTSRENEIIDLRLAEYKRGQDGTTQFKNTHRNTPR